MPAAVTRLALLASVVAAVLLAGGAAAHADGGKTVRVFAPGPKLEASWLADRDGFRTRMRALADRRLRSETGPGAVQRGADDVASHLLGPTDPADPVRTARDLVVWPESVGLMAALGGLKGVPARLITADTGGITAAFAALLASYVPEIAYYATRFPDLALRVPQIRLLGLALTDRFGRVAVETFSELAADLRAWMVVGVDMARDWRVVCADREAFEASPPAPGVDRCDVVDPARVVALRAPDEPTRSYAYEAAGPEMVNMALVFDPSGRVVSRQVKAYLTPTELPGQLDLTPGPTGGLGAVETPVGRLGVVTSKDAWMPDVQAKLDLRGVEVLTQPEFFVGDTVSASGPWAADTLHASGYSALLRRPSFESLVLPELTGNVYEFSADAQSHIAVRPRGRRDGGTTALVGQPPQPGFEVVSRWAVPDPADMPVPERRRALGRAGDLMGPGGPPCPDPREAGPCRNGMVEDVIRADVTVDRRPRYSRDRRRRARVGFRQAPVAPSRSEQRNVALAARGRTVLAAFEQSFGGRQTVFAVRSTDAGRTFARRRIRLEGSGRVRMTQPAAAVSPRRRAWIAWVDERDGPGRVLIARSTDDGRTFGPPRAVATPSGEQWQPALAAAPDGGVHVAFIEEADRSADDDLPQARVLHVRIGPDGRAGSPTRVDQGRPVPLAEKLHNAWAPDVAVRGDRVLVTWVDHRSYDWRPYARASRDGGRTFGPERSVSDAVAMTPDGVDEQIADAPRAAIDSVRDYIAWADWRKAPDTLERFGTAYDAWIATRPLGEGPFGRERRADNLGARQASVFWPDVLADGGDAVVAWQTSHDGVGDIRVARVRGGRDRGRSHRVDDTGRAGINQFRPRIARAGRTVLVAWEDERDGPRQVYLGRADRARIR